MRDGYDAEAAAKRLARDLFDDGPILGSDVDRIHRALGDAYTRGKLSATETERPEPRHEPLVYMPTLRIPTADIDAVIVQEIGPCAPDNYFRCRQVTIVTTQNGTRIITSGEHVTSHSTRPYVVEAKLKRGTSEWRFVEDP